MDRSFPQKQQEFWDDWVCRSFASKNGADNQRRGFYVISEVRKLAHGKLTILDVGCGSGWLSVELQRYGEVTATDYACKAIEILKRDYPEINWSGGDFLSLELPQNHYDIVTCVETIAHVPDQAAFAQKIAKVLRRGGTLLLTTQNEYIWSRTRSLAPPGEGQIRNWPTRDRLIELFSPAFKIEKLRTCAPGGDRGLPRLLNNRFSRAVGRGLFGQARWITIWESLGFGRSLFLVGTRL